MPRINSNQKGKRGEREAAKEWEKHFGVPMRRSQQFCGASDESDDIVGQDGFAIEVKRVERLNVCQALNKTSEDAAEGKVPIVLHRRDGDKRWMATLYLDDLPQAATTLFLTLGSQ